MPIAAQMLGQLSMALSSGTDNKVRRLKPVIFDGVGGIVGWLTSASACKRP